MPFHILPCPAHARRGKLLNVRDAGAAQISGNVEIQNIKQILGLQHGKAYTDAKARRLRPTHRSPRVGPAGGVSGQPAQHPPPPPRAPFRSRCGTAT